MIKRWFNKIVVHFFGEPEYVTHPPKEDEVTKVIKEGRQVVELRSTVAIPFWTNVSEDDIRRQCIRNMQGDLSKEVKIIYMQDEQNPTSQYREYTGSLWVIKGGKDED